MKNYDVKRNLEFFKFRTSNHSLFIETERYFRPILHREERICNFCKNDEIEGEVPIYFLKAVCMMTYRISVFKR